jgi:tight adherence protein C
MIRASLVVVLGGVWSLVPSSRRRWLALPALGVVNAVLALLVGGVVIVAQLLRKLRGRRLATAAAAEELAMLGELALLGLTAGLPFPAALSAAGARITGPLRGEVAMLVRRARSSGLELALAGSGGAARGLYIAVARAMSTGAPVAAAVQAFVDEQDARARNERLVAAQRLPVKLVIPLALLILPGFVLLTVAPALVGAVERFGL